jgi:hypothetical protein
MALALLGLMTGLAKGAASRVEKQREENESLVKTRLQLAAINKKKREAEIEARKKELSDRYSSVQPFLYEGLTEEQKLALVSNPTITKDFVERRSRGEQVDVNNYLITVKDKIPTNFKSVQEYINTLSAPPTAMTEEQMQGAFGRQEGAFGANVGVSPGRAERIAAGLGGGTAAELLAYENMQPVEAEPLADIARINVALFPREPKTLDEQTTQQESVVSAVADQYGEDSDQYAAAMDRLETLKQRKSVLDPDQQSFATMLDRAKAAVANAKDDEQLKTAQQRLDRLIAIGKEGQGRKLPSPASMNNLLTDAAAKAVSRTYGPLIGQGIVTGSERDAEGNTFSTYRYTGGDAEMRARIEATARSAMRAVAETFMDSDGSPISPDLVTALSVNGVSFDPKTGKFNWTYTPPAAVQTTAPAAASAQRVQTPASQAAPAQTAPVRQGLGTRPTNIAEERRNAQAAIAQGAPADAVRKRFKEKTGQDL